MDDNATKETAMLTFDYRWHPPSSAMICIETEAFERGLEAVMLRVPLRWLHFLISDPPKMAQATPTTLAGVRALRVQMFTCIIDVVPWRAETGALFCAGQKVADVLVVG